VSALPSPQTPYALVSNQKRNRRKKPAASGVGQTPGASTSWHEATYWVSDNGHGKSLFYNIAGQKQGLVVGDPGGGRK